MYFILRTQIIIMRTAKYSKVRCVIFDNLLNKIRCKFVYFRTKCIMISM